MKLSKSEENYLKSIYRLQHPAAMVTTNSLAEALRTSAASVTDMLKKLRAKKLLEYKKYYGFRLNKEGIRLALQIIRRHRLWEYFLAAKLGMEWEKVHDIAEELEHVSSDDLIEKLDQYLGNPKTDPHGDPIPDKKGKITPIRQMPLIAFPLKQPAYVSSISNQTPAMMEMLNHYGIQIGSSVMIKKIFELDGSLQIKIARKPECIISGAAAGNIYVYDTEKTA